MNTTPKTLTVEECHQLLNALLVKKGTHKQFVKGLRNYSMVLLMLETGIRVGELVQLRKSDLFYNSEPVISIIVRAEIAKNHSEREIPVSTALSDTIKSLAEHYWPPYIDRGDHYAFFTANCHEPLTTRQVERIVRRACITNLGRPVHPHVLRHTFATRLMRKTNARIVQELLGHKQMSSTQIYMSPNSDDLRKAVDSLPAIQKAGAYDSFLSARGPDSAYRVDASGTDHNHR